MRNAVIGLFVCASLVVTVWGFYAPRKQVFAQRPSIQDAKLSGSLIALSSEGDNRRQVILIDPKAQVMSVYHIDPASGEISLRSVRNVKWDLHMDEFNGVNPSPQEIRSLLQHR